MSISNSAAASILAAIYTATTFANYTTNATSSPETNIHNSLHTADPGETGTLATSEAAYTSYARQNVARSGSGWTAGGTDPAEMALAANLDFPAATGGSETLSYWSTGKTGGGSALQLFSGSVSPTIAVSTGVTPRLTTASKVTLD